MTLAEVLNRLKERHPSAVLVFVGAGFSADLGFPLWRRLLTEAADFAQRFDADHANTIRKRADGHFLERAADPLFEPEIPATERALFFNRRFDERPVLGRRHKLVGALPVAGFLTTNYDATLERSIGFEDRRTPKVFTGPTRFARFSSALQVYRDDYATQVAKSALVLKAHNDTTDPEGIVLSERSFELLRGDPAFKTFYGALLRNYHLVFLGFGGQDDNLLMQAAGVVAEFAGYGLRESYLLLPEGSTPPAGISATPIIPAFFDPRGDYQALEDFVEELNRTWRRMVLPEGGVAPARAFEDLDDGAKPTIFELMAVAFRQDADGRILDAVGGAMIDVAARIASPHMEPAAVSNQLSQHFRISPKLSEELVRRQYQAPPAPPAKNATQNVGAESAEVLARGLRLRCTAFDPGFQVSEVRLVPVVRNVIEGSLQSYGCSIALALVKGDRPRQGDLAHLVRDQIRPGRWEGIGEVEAAALSLAIPDLFLKPSDSEGRILAHLAVTATAFGLIQALPAEDIPRHLSPSTIYLDTTCILPLLTRVEPRYSAYSPLVTLARARGIRLVFQRSFVNEAATHFKKAGAFLREGNIRSITALQEVLRGTLIEYANVFLAALVQGRYEGGADPQRALSSLFAGTEEDFAKAIGRLGIDVLEFSGPAEEIERIKALIVTGKQNWYERSVTARGILARNEASQLLELEKRAMEGAPSWFATGDAQLRRIARERDLPGSQYVLPVGGAVALLEALSTGHDLGPAFARMLWSPNTQDQLDQRLSAELSSLLQQGKLDIRAPLPIEEARQLAATEFREKIQRARRADDLEIDTSPEPVDIGRLIGESVYQAIGQAIESQRKKH